ncbi:tRNA pseudouridine(38-40) synthase [Aequitasia blattaphilus]|uniref:tRNA pseudouridine synthase A n=1 Tax=Aequitasia blattaphilus TaxID=2949332 RepID=A0ABT1E6Z9_9FIRM|nr:tRNA pseudouridine synthase A [Aequitasia blattaphilus]MCP1101594.1 tRNA pseudouridine synthase A [Aequitasia blattaphilus]MCR8614234.1 tRNA pseudouridine synthase A [Aequitasia blattaphilus]
MRNILLKIEYDGSRYQGWSRHGSEVSTNTISHKIIEVIKKMTDETDVELYGGIRTEVGVHAYSQYANFKTCSTMVIADMKHYMNKYLPMDIAIVNVKEVPERFHAKLNARSKTYLYRMTISDVPSVFDRKHTFYCFKEPDQLAMKEASMLLVGQHDFQNFSTGKSNKATIKEIFEIEIYGDNEELQILIHADDFLYNMVRIIIGTLLEIGFGTRKKEDITKIFSGTAKPSTPCDSKGLFLQDISY